MALAKKGAHIIMACRDTKKGEAIAEKIHNVYPMASLTVEQVDFNNLRSVKEFADRLIALGRPIDRLFNNAGVLDLPLTLDETDSLDATFKTNYLSHFLLTNRLLEIMADHGRIIFTGSTHHQYGNCDLDDLQSLTCHANRRPYNNSKFMLLMFCMELQRRLVDSTIISVAAHPGFTATNILTSTKGKQIGFFKQKCFGLINVMMGQAPEMGVIPLLYAGTAPNVKGGEYYGPSGFMEYSGKTQLTKCAQGVYDEKIGAQLWKASETILNHVFSVHESNEAKMKCC